MALEWPQHGSRFGAELVMFLGVLCGAILGPLLGSAWEYFGGYLGARLSRRGHGQGSADF